jgi:hypothetical protein
VIGAGAAGLMCALTAGQRGRRVLVLDHANKAGKKILMSGGGYCNFTNLYTSPDNFLSTNPHFCKSALSRYTPYDFLAMVEQHGIAYREKAEGQLFCVEKARVILDMLRSECDRVKVKIQLRTNIESISRNAGFRLETSHGQYACESLVVATGGLSIPTLGATGFGYDIARQFGLNVLATRAALVPFTLSGKMQAKLADLSGLSLPARISCGDFSITDDLLFTHRGLSGPAILQLSSYWQPGEAISIDLLPELDVEAFLRQQQTLHPKMELKNVLAEKMPKRLAQRLCELWLESRAMNQYSAGELQALAQQLQHWQIKPSGSEGYRTAEVTLGGVDTRELSSRTLEANAVPGLYFVGEVVDVTGQLGGFNFQWAWASGWAAGQVV